MMMPANYSAIAENEMTYVVGGGIVADILPAVMTVDNWKLVNTNMITLISNYTANAFAQGTVGTIFGGKYTLGAVTGSVIDMFKATKTEDGISGNGVLNACLAIVGGLANIYTLGNVTVSSIYNTGYANNPFSYSYITAHKYE